MGYAVKIYEAFKEDEIKANLRGLGYAFWKDSISIRYKCSLSKS